jgi:hypothetical protein
MVFYKVLDANGCSCNGGSLKWSLPVKNEDGTWTPGEWTPEIAGPLVECRNGYHLATIEQLPQWLNDRIFVAEVDGELVESSDRDKWVARRVRLVRETAWDERTARLFACDCAEHVLYLYERDHPSDMRPRQAIETARRYASGQATEEELSAAWAAAGAAAWAARAAAWAARAAAWAAAGAAALAAGVGERKWQAARLAEYLDQEVWA